MSELVKITVEEFTQIYRDYMEEDFPKDELKPLERMTEMMQKGLCIATKLMQENQMRAYAIFIIPPKGAYMLLDDFAVKKEYRGTGVGHSFFEALTVFVKNEYPRIQGMLIESERIEEDKADVETRKRRIAFYRDCGCQMTQVESNLFGVDYSVLHFPFMAGAEAGEKELDFIYQTMFEKNHYENDVRVWHVEK